MRYRRIFLTGPAGTGKTTQGVARLKELLSDGVLPHNILILLPQRTGGALYQEALQDPALNVPGLVDAATMDGLALRSLNLVWPQIASDAGFGRPTRRPVFLTIETAQYYMAQVIQPMMQQGYFDPNVVSVTITLPRLMSQLLDNLEKAALIGLPYTQVETRLKSALGAEISSRVAFEHAQACVIAFREFCLRNNLLDFSLRVEIFRNHVWANPELRRLLTGRYRHLIVDNLEEQNSFTHRILQDWLPESDSALLIFDEDAGYRIFLGANQRTAQDLAQYCDTVERRAQSFTASPETLELGRQISVSLGKWESGKVSRWAGEQGSREAEEQGGRRTDVDSSPTFSPAHLPTFSPAHLPTRPPAHPPNPRAAFTYHQSRFHPQMLNWAIEQVDTLINGEGVSPRQIVVLAPFVSDALRFSFLNRMERLGLPARSHRPSRALKEEPAAVALLALARLMRPHWKLLPASFDVMQTLNLVIDGLDLVRAQLLVDVLYRPHNTEDGPLLPFEEIEGDVRERITYQIGLRFDRLRAWLRAEKDAIAAPLDHSFSRLFGEILSQPGFGFHNSLEAGEVAANLIESIRKFRRVTSLTPVIRTDAEGKSEEVLPDNDALNRDYLQMLEQGVVAALYTRSWDPAPADAVLIAPAYTYLMSNRPVDYQIWLDAGSSGWWERIAQPLTHPYVLSADWQPDAPWRDEDEVKTQLDRLHRLTLGLTRRCRKHIYIANSEISEHGYEQRGRLLLALQQMLRRLGRTTGEMSRNSDAGE